MEEQKIMEDWRNDITPNKDTLKVKDGESSIFTFLDDGTKKNSKDYGDSIAFQIKIDNDEKPKIFYVKSNNFSFLGKIKEFGKLAGLKVKVSRIGSKKSDTRYTIEKV